MVTPDEIRKMAAEQSFRERPILAEFLSDIAETVEALQADAERYRWLVENAVIYAASFKHEGKDPASTKQPLDNAIDAARKDHP